ncbi:MAG: hypothetical protein WC076_03890 [Terrimicrobiaceae bacterium]|jgi:D-glycero-alpha-D-manno-heptose-7-phosphate kinase
MVISRTPHRISLFGGGSDYPSWYLRHGGAALAASIDKYCYLSCRDLPPFFDHRIRLMYSQVEQCAHADEIRHPAVRCALKHLGIEHGVEIHISSDLPARSGMGSSSSFAVGILHALYALQGRMCSKERLAREAVFLEQEILKENVGSQDQMTAAYGGINVLRFGESGEVSVAPVLVAGRRIRELQSHLMLFYTGIVRTASDVAGTFVPRLAEKAGQIHRFVEMVDEAVEILETGEIRAIGSLLHEAWMAKRTLSAAVSNPSIDALYERALASGALGGKILGAGGGGFILFFVPPDRQEAVRRALAGLLHVPFHFEFGGSQIIFYDPGQGSAELEAMRFAQLASF